MAKTKKPGLAPALISEHGLGQNYLTPAPKPTPPPTLPPMRVATPATSSAYSAPASYGTPGIPEYKPDYAKLINDDSLLGQQRVDLAAGGIASAAERKAANDRAYIQFGEPLDLTSTVNGLGLDRNSPLFQSLFADIDPTTQNAAQALTNSKLSTSYGLRAQHEGNLDTLLSALAARGSVRSGATGVGTGIENQNYLGSQFSARNSLLQYLAGVQAAFGQSEQARQNQLAQYLNDATTRQIAENPYRAAVPAIPGERGPNDTTVLPGDTGGYTNAPDYFAANPMPQGTSTADALAALNEASRVYGPTTSTLSGYGLPEGVSVAPPAAAPAPPRATADTSQTYANSIFRRLNLPE